MQCRPKVYPAGLLQGRSSVRKSSVWMIGLYGLMLGMFVLALAGCQPNTGSSVSQVPTVTVPPNYPGSVRITFSASTTYEQAVAVVQNAGMQLVGPSCIGQGTLPRSGVPTATPDQRALYAQSHMLTAGLRITQAMVDSITASSQVTAVQLIHIPLCV